MESWIGRKCAPISCLATKCLGKFGSKVDWAISMLVRVELLVEGREADFPWLPGVADGFVIMPGRYFWVAVIGWTDVLSAKMSPLCVFHVTCVSHLWIFLWIWSVSVTPVFCFHFQTTHYSFFKCPSACLKKLNYVLLQCLLWNLETYISFYRHI